MKPDAECKLLSPAKRRKAVKHIRDKMDVSERRACKILKQSRATQRRRPIIRDDEDRLSQRIVQLASAYGRYAYRRMTALLRVVKAGG